MKIIIQLDESDKETIYKSAFDLIYKIHGNSLTEDELREKCHKSIIGLMEGISLQEKTTEMVDRMMFEVHTEFFNQFNRIYRGINKSMENINGLLSKGGMDSESK